VLEPLEESHAPLLYAPLRDDALYRWIPQDPPVSVDALRDRYRRLETRQSPGGEERWLNWAMRLSGTAHYVGLLEVTIVPGRTAFVAYMVFTKDQRQGYAAEGLGRVVTYLGSEQRVQKFAAQIDTRNAASIALVERLGFVRVATIRNADHFKGTASDEYRYELDCDRR
jgi:RimJ/RimL family protein N-acetyltransferase